MGRRRKPASIKHCRAEGRRSSASRDGERRDGTGRLPKGGLGGGIHETARLGRCSPCSGNQERGMNREEVDAEHEARDGAAVQRDGGTVHRTRGGEAAGAVAGLRPATQHARHGHEGRVAAAQQRALHAALHVALLVGDADGDVSAAGGGGGAAAADGTPRGIAHCRRHSLRVACALALAGQLHLHRLAARAEVDDLHLRLAQPPRRLAQSRSCRRWAAHSGRRRLLLAMHASDQRCRRLQLSHLARQRRRLRRRLRLAPPRAL
mmetsp:Transcript_23081/g.57990  ORF Transcript_23081/g.57990 Transcript_23081/m.57990 type:complete len:264 (+) Transcript_23081:128-919(+)